MKTWINRGAVVYPETFRRIGLIHADTPLYRRAEAYARQAAEAWDVRRRVARRKGMPLAIPVRAVPDPDGPRIW